MTDVVGLRVITHGSTTIELGDQVDKHLRTWISGHLQHPPSVFCPDTNHASSAAMRIAQFPRSTDGMDYAVALLRDDGERLKDGMSLGILDFSDDFVLLESWHVNDKGVELYKLPNDDRVTVVLDIHTNAEDFFVHDFADLTTVHMGWYKRDLHHYCFECKQEGEHKTKSCTCGSKRYCGKECQMAHWRRVHRMEHQKFRPHAVELLSKRDPDQLSKPPPLLQMILDNDGRGGYLLPNFGSDGALAYRPHPKINRIILQGYQRWVQMPVLMFTPKAFPSSMEKVVSGRWLFVKAGFRSTDERDQLILMFKDHQPTEEAIRQFNEARK